MVTTIQVKEETLEMLKKLKEPSGQASYDEIIKRMIKKSTQPYQSLYGFLGKKPMKKILEGLRDESDRI